MDTTPGRVRRLMGAVGMGYGAGGVAGALVSVLCACFGAALLTAWLGGGAATLVAAAVLAGLARGEANRGYNRQ